MDLHVADNDMPGRVGPDIEAQHAGLRDLAQGPVARHRDNHRPGFQLAPLSRVIGAGVQHWLAVDHQNLARVRRAVCAVEDFDEIEVRFLTEHARRHAASGRHRGAGVAAALDTVGERQFHLFEGRKAARHGDGRHIQPRLRGVRARARVRVARLVQLAVEGGRRRGSVAARPRPECAGRAAPVGPRQRGGGAEARERAPCAEPPGPPRPVCGVELVGGEGGGARGGGAATTHGSVAPRGQPVGQGLLELAGEHGGVGERGASARLHVEVAAAPDAPRAVARLGGLACAVAGGGAEARERAPCAEPPGPWRSVCGVELVGGEGGGARGDGAATTYGSGAPRQARCGGGLCQMAARGRPLRAALGPGRGREAARRASRLAACCRRGGTGGTGGGRTGAALGAAAAPLSGGTRMDSTLFILKTYKLIQFLLK